MIATREELRDYILRDARANGRSSPRPRLLGDEIWKFLLTMCRLDYCAGQRKKNPLFLPAYAYLRWRYHRWSVKLGFSIPWGVCGKGLAIPHYGCVVVHGNAALGEDCRLLDGVNIGATNGSTQAPRLGDRVFVGSGAKLLGGITIADDVAIGANAVVVRSITESGTTWGGVPARKLSSNSSRANQNPALFHNGMPGKRNL